MKLDLICSTTDGIEPAVMLSGECCGKAQYLFNAPEGLSRVLLEHKMRPDATLKAIFAIKNSAMGGLPGLIMRLNSDGHKAVQVIGPEGTSRAVTGMSHFLRWQHPQVLVKDLDPLSHFAYEDDVIGVAPLAGAPACWSSPTWRGPASGVRDGRPAATATLPASLDAGKFGTASSSLQSGSGRERASEALPSPSRVSTGYQEVSSSTISGRSGEDSDSDTSEDAVGLDSNLARHMKLDQLLSQQGPRARQGVLSAMRDVLADGEAKFQSLASKETRPAESQEKRNHENNSTPWLRAAGCPNPVFHSISILKSASEGPSPKFWGYLIYMKSVQARILILDCDSFKAWSYIQSHPLFLEQASSGNKIVAVLHFSPDRVVSSKKYVEWMRNLPGRQVTMTNKENGRAYLASFRVSAMANAIAPAIFPLYPCTASPALTDLELGGHCIPARMLMSLSLSTDVAVAVTVQCSQSDAIDDIQAQLLEAKPHLLVSVGELKVCSLWNEAIKPPSPRTALPALALPCWSMSKTRMERSIAGRPGSTPRAQPPYFASTWQGIPMAPRNRPYLDLASQQQQGMPGQPHWAYQVVPGMQLGQYAQVLRHGQPVGVVQLTHQGWAGPPELLAIFAQQCQAGSQYQPTQPATDPIISQPHPLNSRPVHPPGFSGVLACQHRQAGWTPGHEYQLPSNSFRKLNPSGAELLSHQSKRRKVERESRPVRQAPDWKAEDIELAGDEDLEFDASLPPVQQQLSHPSLGAAVKSGPPQSKDAQSGSEDQHLGGDLLQQVTSQGAACMTNETEIGKGMPAQQNANVDDVSLELHNDCPPYLEEMRRQDDWTQLRFLGTGCAEPSKYRAASGIHLLLKNGFGILLDAGEGTFGQMCRYYGAQEAKRQVSCLVAILISHRHADHLVGLPGLFAARKPSDPPLLIIGPKAAQRWLEELDKKLFSKYHFLHCQDAFGKEACGALQWLQQGTGLHLKVIPVVHCSDAWGFVVQHTDGWSLCYSGDTLPCSAVREAAQNCTVLIHEATFSPSLGGQAKLKAHSTSEEALSIGRQSQAYRTILTHFSQRYPKVPPEIDLAAADRAAVAFDGMRVPLTALPDLPKLLPLLCQIWAEADNSGEVAKQICSPGIETSGKEGFGNMNAQDPAVTLPEPSKQPQHVRFDDSD